MRPGTAYSGQNPAFEDTVATLPFQEWKMINDEEARSVKAPSERTPWVHEPSTNKGTTKVQNSCKVGEWLVIFWYMLG